APLQGQTENLVEKGNQQPGLTGLFTVFNVKSPQVYVDVNRSECLSQGVDLNDVFDTMRVYLGSRYVNDFNRFGRPWQVVGQADQKYRRDVKDVRKLMVRNAQGKMVPLGAIATVKEINAPMVLTRYNMYPAAAIQGNTTQGTSTGDMIDIVQQLS